MSKETVTKRNNNLVSEIKSIRLKAIKVDEVVKLRAWIDDISEYTNPDGGGAYHAVTKIKSLVTRLENRKTRAWSW